MEKGKKAKARRVSDHVEKAWHQAQQGEALVQILNSDYAFIKNVTIHKLIALPHTDEYFINNLCNEHKNVCITKKTIESQDSFDRFLNCCIFC